MRRVLKLQLFGMTQSEEVALEHERQHIRYAVAAQLVGAAPAFATPAGPRVWPARVIPFRNFELPALAVYTDSDGVDDESKWTSPRELRHSLEVVIEAATKSSSGLDESLDRLCKAIERAMESDITFGGWASWSCLSRTDIEMVEIAERPMGIARLVYEVRYYSDAEGDEKLYNLLQVDAKWNLGGAQAPADRAEDLFGVAQ